MGYQSDLEIAQRCTMQPICDIARTVGIDDADIEPYGRYKAKVALSVLGQPPRGKGKLILVTAITPTPAGEGKTTTTIGLADALRRINGSLGFDDESYHRALAASMLVSCDNAHAVHPNHAEKCDARSQVVLNGGIVIKEAANQHYCTDAFSRAVFQAICDDADVPTQAFANKSDMAGGSTLGNLSNMQASMHAVDVGLPQLAMHSSYETGGVRDVMYAIRALTAFYERNLTINGAESVEL